MIPTAPSSLVASNARPVGAFDPSHRPENSATVAAIYIGGALQSKTAPVAGWASEMTFDVVVNSAGGGPASMALGVTFANPTPKDDVGDDAYKVVVKVGDVVGVMSSGRHDSFWIPWMPYVKPCPGQRAGGGGGQDVPKDGFGGDSGNDDDPGGGGGTPTQGGAGAGGVGEGGQQGSGQGVPF